jgi:15-cis-phytoene synthase
MNAGASESEREQLACRAILKKGSKSFFFASRLLPARLQGPTAALYAFCRQMDDAVDDVPQRDALGAVDRLEKRLDAVYAGKPFNTVVDRAFARIAETYALPKAIPQALVEGMRWDAEGRTYETMADVEGYGMRVAGTVGLMMTVLMGERRSALLSRACDLGVAMQLTNIARDVGEDASRGRCYLPENWLGEEGLSGEQVVAMRSFDPRVGKVVERLLASASALYERADTGIESLPKDCRISIRAARLIYSDIGRVVTRNGFDSFSTRAHTSLGRKLWLLLGALRARPIPAALPSAAETLPSAQPLLDTVGTA